MSVCRRLGLAVLLFSAWGGLAAAQTAVAPRSVEKAFSPGGRVWMNLSAGDYTIKPGADDRVRVELSTRDPDDVSALKAEMRVEGRDLTLTTRGPRGGMKVLVEVPARCDLTIRLSAGDLRVSGIQGSKDVSSWAGDIDLEVGSPSDYGRVEASVTAGDLTAAPFDVRKGGLFRSFSWKGNGRYSLRARLTAGDLVLR